MSIDFSKLDKTSDPDEVHKLLLGWGIDEIDRYETLMSWWEFKLLFYSGKQWLKTENTSTTDGTTYVDLTTEDTERFYPVTNFCRHWSSLKRSHILGKNIRTKVSPNESTNKQDVDSANLGRLVLRAKDEIDDEEAIDEEMFELAQVFGIGFRRDFRRCNGYIEKPVFDQVKNEYFQCTSPGCEMIDEAATLCPQCGADMDFKRETEMQPSLDEQGQQVKEAIPTYTSDVAVLDPFRVRHSPAVTFGKITWIDEADYVDLDFIKQYLDKKDEGYYSENIGKIKGKCDLPRALKLSEQYKRALGMNVSAASGGDVARSDPKQDRDDGIKTPMHRSYFEPSSNHRQGRMIIWTPEALLYDGVPDVPNNNKLKRWHGYTALPYKKNLMSSEGIGYIDDLIPINRKVNSFDAIIMEYIDKSASPDRIEFGNVQQNNPDASEGVLVLEPRPELPNGGAPMYLNHPQVSSEIIRQRDAMVQEGKEIGKVTDIIQGIHPAGVETYRGMELLADSADSADSDTFKVFQRYKRKSSQLKLAILQDCLKTRDPDLTEIMKGIASDLNLGKLEIDSFTGEDLRDNLNVVIEETGYLSLSTGARQDRVKDLISSTLLSPEDIQDPIVKLQLLRKFGLGDMPLSDKADIEKSERMIQYMEIGEFETVKRLTFNPMIHFDNRAIQVRVWSEWMKTSRFESLQDNIKQGSIEILTLAENDLLAASAPPTEGPPGAQPPPPGAPSPSPAMPPQ